MNRYSPEQRRQAVALAEEHGPAEAARQTGIPKRTISSWREPAHAEDQRNQTAAAREAAATRVAEQWGEYRSREATAAGVTAARLRREIIDRVENGGPGRDLQALAISYGILIDKAELLSGQATERIEMWAESELDRDLHELLNEMEARIREEGNG